MISGHVTIYVEGGSKGALVTECRRGFNQFFTRAGLKGHMPKVIPCGPRGEAFKNFCIALKNHSPDDFPLLLVDSEGPVSETPWQHVLHRVGDGWQKPDGAVDAHLHFMMQMMEAWFLADVAALAAYFGPKFQAKKLPKNKSIESVPKNDIESSLDAAAQDTPKGTYKKGRDSFEILSKLNPQLVAESSPHAKRFLDHLKQLTPAGSHS